MRLRPAVRSSDSDSSSFGPTSGQLTGFIGVGCGVLALVLSAIGEAGDHRWSFMLGALFVIAVCWALMLRPRVVLEPERVVLRNAFSDCVIPYAAIDGFAVRSMTVVTTGDKRYLGLGVGRTRKNMTGADRHTNLTGGRLSQMPVPQPEKVDVARLTDAQVADFVEEQVERRMGMAAATNETPRRVLAVPEVAAVVITGVPLVIIIVLAIVR